jgi:alkyl hydroperoxide reductase subunit AhpC
LEYQNYSTTVKEAQKMLARAGKQAPDFDAIAFCDGDFRDVKLSDHRGKWIVLCFYPGDFTFVCPTELTAVAAVYDSLRALEVEVLAVSTDSRFTHKIWQEEELSKMVPGGVVYPLVSDPTGQIGTLYGVYDEETGMEIRSRFIIDPDFTIRMVEAMTPEVGDNVSELIRVLKGFQHNRATGEMIPSGWQPGKLTLKPDPDLAGKVWQIWKTEMAF